MGIEVIDEGVVEGLALHSSKGRIALVATVAASAMASLDATVVNVALPHIGEQFHASISSLQWVLTGYLVALASLILLGGALGDRFGRRKVFVIGTVWFAAASLLCGAAPNIEVLVAARVLQGVGGALLTPGSLAILQASFRETDRAAAVGAWSGLGGVAGAIGPFVGGGLVDGPGWRWAFLINVPVAAIAIVCAHAAIPETRDPHAGRSLDLVGALFAVVGLAASTWALTEAGPHGWTSAGVLGAAVVSVVAIAAFVRRMMHTSDPLVPPALFRNRTFTVVNLETVLLYGGLGVSFFLVSYELQVATGWSALQAGVALLPATVLMLLLSASSGSLAQRIGPRLQLTAGPLLAAAGLLAARSHRRGCIVGHRCVARSSGVRRRARHVRRSTHRDGDGRRRSRPCQRGVGSQQRHRQSCGTHRACRDPGGVGPDCSDRACTGHPCLPAGPDGDRRRRCRRQPTRVLRAR